ncbi:MAG: hypothetical protein HYS39_01495 [Proteobacteria bacterium]|nr:hypothetical protein [Pseudomonadota bacterium]
MEKRSCSHQIWYSSQGIRISIQNCKGMAILNALVAQKLSMLTQDHLKTHHNS